MALNSYSALKDSVAAWLNEADLVTRIPDFIALTEAVINRRIDHRRMVGVTTLSFSTDRAALPSDFTAVRAVRIDSNATPRLDFMTLDAYAARNTSEGGPPQRYSLAGDYMLFDPPASASLTATLIYSRRVEPLSEAGGNWLLEAFPDVYLYGALSAAAPYVEDADRGAIWAQLFEKALGEVNADGQSQSFGGTLQTDNGQPRIF
jgi:hypothetical protein